MAAVINKTSGLTMVSEVIEALQKFPPDMPIRCALADCVTIYQTKPQSGEHFEDRRGEVWIDGDDPWGDDD